MSLKKCNECGGKVSKEAYQCPHCHSDPHGKKCRICGKIMKIAEAVRVLGQKHKMKKGWDDNYYESDEYERHDRFVHQKCLLGLFPDTELMCPDCRHPVNVRAYGLAAAPELWVPDQSKAPGWTYSSSSGWVSYPGKPSSSSSCPSCGRTRPLHKVYRHGFLWLDKWVPYSCAFCNLPILRNHGYRDSVLGDCHDSCYANHKYDD